MGKGMGLVALGVGLAACATQPGVAQQRDGRQAASEGVVAYRSNADFAETVARAEPAIKGRGLFVMRTMDHAAAAKQSGRTLSPNTVVLFGNPAVGSQVMTCAPRAGIDLPQKLQVWEEDGAVLVGYNDPAYLVARHSIEGCDEVLAGVAETLDELAREVAGGG